MTAVNSFHPALKYTWEISNTSLAFLDIKVLSKATVYAAVCSTNPQILIVICCIHLHIYHTSRIPFLILSFLDFVAFVVRTLIFPCNFFDKRGYPASVVQVGHHHAQQIDRQSALQMSQKENNNRILFTLISSSNTL